MQVLPSKFGRRGCMPGGCRLLLAHEADVGDEALHVQRASEVQFPAFRLQRRAPGTGGLYEYYTEYRRLYYGCAACARIDGVISLEVSGC